MGTQSIQSIRNLGPAVEIAFARAGITTADELRELGADEAYRRLIASGTRPHFIGYYALVMGLQGRPWNDLDAAEKSSLRTRFDALKSTTPQDDTGIDRALAEIGVVPKSGPTNAKGRAHARPLTKSSGRV